MELQTPRALWNLLYFAFKNPLLQFPTQNFYVLKDNLRLSPKRSPTPTSTHYIIIYLLVSPLRHVLNVSLL